MAENIFEKAKASASAVKNKITDLKENLWDEEKNEIIEQFKSGREGKLKEIVNNLNSHAALFTEAGYQLNSISISLVLPPVISIGFTCLESIPDDKRQQMVDKTGDSRISSLILKSLFKASDFSDSIKIGDIKLKTVNITLGLIPGISITLA